MKTLLLNGSPHRDGHTAALVAELKTHLQGEVSEWNAVELNIPPCVDCRYCKTKPACCLPQDQMRDLRSALGDCDRLVIASPIWMETLTPPLLALLSRLQPLFYHKELRPQGIRKAGVLLTGGGSGGAQGAYASAKVLFRQLNVGEVYPLIAYTHTDSIPAKEDAATLEAVRTFAEWLNE